MKPFLTAEWRKLLVINYEVDAAILHPYLPFGTELDLFEGKCYVSLIGFMFLNTKVKGIRFPGLCDFEEVNLRFYVRRIVNGEWRRGVVFIRELVPKKILAMVANLFYKEHYKAVPMSHQLEKLNDKIKIKYWWKYADVVNSISVTTQPTKQGLLNGSEAHFILEHYYGYTKVSESKTYEYEVKHPVWEIYSVIDYLVDVNFEVNYGKDFSFLNNQSPCSVYVAEGSEISVMDKINYKL